MTLAQVKQGYESTNKFPMPISAQPELLRMQTLTNKELLSIAHSSVPVEKQNDHQELLNKNSSTNINTEEKLKLRQLRQDADLLMLRKAYAWSILHERGHHVPSLQELPIFF